MVRISVVNEFASAIAALTVVNGLVSEPSCVPSAVTNRRLVAAATISVGGMLSLMVMTFPAGAPTTVTPSGIFEPYTRIPAVIPVASSTVSSAVLVACVLTVAHAAVAILST